MNQTLSLVKLSEDQKVAIYKGLSANLRIPITSFVNRTPPPTFEVIGDFAEVTAREAKPKETAEERKARLSALPKLTLAEKVKRMEEKLTKMREKAARTAAPATAAVNEAEPVGV